ncbi:MAG: hypothetical protein V9G23_02610 [Giesbergeria sp.]
MDDQVRRSDVLLDAPAPARPGPRRRAWRAVQRSYVWPNWRTSRPARARRRRLRHRPQMGALSRTHLLAAGRTRVVVCNADEGEPGTFKDRVLLNAASRCGVRGHDGGRSGAGCAPRACLYLRGEYRFLLEAPEAGAGANGVATRPAGRSHSGQGGF